MEPAKSIIEKLGGEKAVAAILGLAVTAPYRWQHAIEKGGTGGLIPTKQAAKLIEHARSNGIALEPSEFFPAPQPEAAE